MDDRRLARWRLRTQGLTEPHAGSAAEVVGRLLAVQAENVGQSAWAVATRTVSPEVSSLADALASGEVVRTHVLRSTWHYVLRSDADWLQQLTAPAVLPLYERGLGTEMGFDAAALDRLVASVLTLLTDAPDRLRTEVAGHLRAEHPDLADRLDGRAAMYLMAWCEIRRLVVSGRPRGTGPEAQHTYARWEDRIGPPVAPEHFDREAAMVEVVTRYVAGHGPVTGRDLTYWATLPLAAVRRGLGAAEDLQSFEHDGRTYWHLGEPPVDRVADPRGHLLQLLDEMYRGYQDSRWVIDADGRVPRGRETALGIALVDGQLVARMRRDLDRTKVRFRLEPHRPLAPAQRTSLEEAARRYGDFLGRQPSLEVMTP